MSVVNGQKANAENFNEAFTSRKDNNSIGGIISLTNSEEDSGSGVANLQGQINQILATIGLQSFPDANNLIYDSENDPTNFDNGETIKIVLKNIDSAIVAAIDRITALEGYSPKANFTATLAPTTTDDAAQDYQIGSFWIDTLTDNFYVCKDNTESAAIWVHVNEAKAGATGINYITNSDAEENTDDWTNSGILFVKGRSSSDPFRGEYSFTMEKDVGDASTQYIYSDISIDKADLDSYFELSFIQELLSGTYLDDDIKIEVEKDPNGTPSDIQVVNSLLKANQKKKKCYFKADSSNQEYRIKITVNTTSTDVFTLRVDEIQIKPISEIDSQFEHDISNNTSNDTVACEIDSTTHRAKIYEYYALRGTNEEYGKFILSSNNGSTVMKTDQNGDCGITLGKSVSSNTTTLTITSSDDVDGIFQFNLVREFLA